MDDLLDAALAGARFLDSRMPGWRRKIRRRDLDMNLGYYRAPGECGCILAQLTGDYFQAVTDLGIEGSCEYELGFMPPDGGGDLTGAWKRVLRENLR